MAGGRVGAIGPISKSGPMFLGTAGMRRAGVFHSTKLKARTRSRADAPSKTHARSELITKATSSARPRGLVRKVLGLGNDGRTAASCNRCPLPRAHASSVDRAVLDVEGKPQRARCNDPAQGQGNCSLGLHTHGKHAQTEEAQRISAVVAACQPCNGLLLSSSGLPRPREQLGQA